MGKNVLVKAKINRFSLYLAFVAEASLRQYENEMHLSSSSNQQQAGSIRT